MQRFGVGPLRVWRFFSSGKHWQWNRGTGTVWPVKNNEALTTPKNSTLFWCCWMLDPQTSHGYVRQQTFTAFHGHGKVPPYLRSGTARIWWGTMLFRHLIVFWQLRLGQACNGNIGLYRILLRQNTVWGQTFKSPCCRHINRTTKCSITRLPQQSRGRIPALILLGLLILGSILILVAK